MLFQRYRSAVDRLVADGCRPHDDAEAAAATELRENVLGGRVIGGFVGTAPLSSGDEDVHRVVLDAHIIDGYGTHRDRAAINDETA